MECGVWGVYECGSWDSEVKLEKVRVGLGEAYPDIHPTNPPGGLCLCGSIWITNGRGEKKLQAVMRCILSGIWIVL